MCVLLLAFDTGSGTTAATAREAGIIVSVNADCERV